MTAAREVVGRARLGWVDGLRGAAVLLMVLDHVLVQVEPGHVLRFTVTRAALPLFMVAAAAVWRPASRRRVAVLAGAALLELVLGAPLGMAVPGIVAVFLAVSCLVWAVPGVRNRPGVAGALGLIQALYVPLPWAGYQPGLVLLWWSLGRLAGGELMAAGRRLPSWVQAVGRRPMRWYLGHLAVLMLLFGH